MTIFDSEQFAKVSGVPVTLVKTNEWGGRVRVAYWRFTVSAAEVETIDRVRVVKIPSGSRVIGGKAEFNSAFGVGSVLDVGVLGNLGKYASGVDIAAAGDTDLGLVSVGGDSIGQEVGSSIEEVLLSHTGSTWPVNATVNGYILYVLD